MPGIDSLKQERQNTVLSWSNASNYDDARKEWTLLRRASEDSKCGLCGRPLEHPVYIKNTVNHSVRIVGSGCCQTYITDVDSDDPEKTFKRRLEEAEDKSRFEEDLKEAEQKVDSFYCPFTGKLPMVTNNCSKCNDEFIKRLCEQFFLYPEVNLAKYKKYNLSDRKFEHIQNRIQRRAIEEFVRIAREIEDKTCPLLVRPKEMSCNNCTKFVNTQFCSNSIWADSLLPLKSFFIKLAGPQIYIETIDGLFAGHDIKTGNILKISISTKSTISMFKCPVTGLFPQSNRCNQDCSIAKRLECNRAEAYFEAFKQSGGINCRDIIEDYLVCEAKDELLNRLSTTFSPDCSLITDPSMLLSDCLNYNCFTTLNSKTCPFDEKHKSMVDREKVEKLDAIDRFVAERERDKRSFYNFRKIVFYRLKESYIELIEIYANSINYFGPLAKRLPKEKKISVKKRKKLSEAAKERGERENVLAAKAYFKALKLKAGCNIDEEVLSLLPWEDWIEDWNENDPDEPSVSDRLKDAGLENYVKEAMDLEQIVKDYGNINNMIAAWAKHYNILNYKWPFEPWKFPIAHSSTITLNMVIKISNVDHNTLKRWFSFLRPIPAQNLIDIDWLIKNPVTTKELTDIILDDKFTYKSNDYNIFKYLIKYAGKPIKDLLSNSMRFNIDPWSDVNNYNGLQLLWAGHGQVLGYRYLEACKKVGWHEFANNLYRIFKIYAYHNNKQCLQPYYKTCEIVRLKPLQLKRPTIYFRKNAETVTLDEIKKQVKKYQDKHDLSHIYDDICLVQYMKGNGLKGEDILDIWAYQIGMGNDYTKICNIMNLGNRVPYNKIITGIDRDRLLEVAGRQTNALCNLALLFNKFTKKPITIIDIDDILREKETTKYERIFIYETIYAALENMPEVSPFIIRKLIEHRPKQIIGGLSYLLTFTNIRVQQLLFWCNDFFGVKTSNMRNMVAGRE